MKKKSFKFSLTPSTTDRSKVASWPVPETAQDIYTAEASQMFSVPIDQVTKDQYKAARASLFTRMYN